MPFAVMPPGEGTMPTTGRWGWYQDHEGNSYRRTSTLVKEVETDREYLDLWKLRQVAEGMSVRDDLVLALKAMGRPPVTGWTREQKKQIDEIAEKAMQAAKTTDGAITGTAMHTLTERVDRGEPIDTVAAGLPATTAQSLRAYAKLRELNGWQTVEIERTVVCDELQVAGTFDRVEYLPELDSLLGPGVCQYGHGPDDEHFGGHDDRPFDGLPVIADVKTEKDPTLNGLHIGPQLAIYSRARRMWKRLPGMRHSGRTYPSGDPIMVPNGEYVAAPCVRQDVGVVVHVADGDAAPLLINLAEGWSAARAAHEQINRKSRAKRKLGAQGAWFAPLPTRRPDRLSSFTETAAAAAYADPYRPGPGQQAAVGVDAAGGAVVARLCGPGGSVTYVTSGPEAVGGHGSLPPAIVAAPAPAEPAAPELGDEKEVVRGQLIAAIWQARTLDGLAILWNMANDRGVSWSGPIAMAGDARRRQIECVQRSMHVPGTVKCACGWMSGQVA
jgi:hypothetical protein